MTTVEAATSADNEQATNLAAQEGIPAAAESGAPVAETPAEPVAPEAQLAADRQATAAAAAQQAAAPAAVEAPAEVAAAEMPKPVAKKVAVLDKDEKDEDADANSDEAPVDLAMASDAAIFDAIAAADGARSVGGAEGEASALRNEDGSLGIVPIIGFAALAAGAIVLLTDGDSEVVAPPPPPPPPANTAPTFTSGGTASVAENVATTTVVYDANATDAQNDAITYSLTGTDAAAFTINATTGEVRFVNSPDFETKSSYSFNVVATAAGQTTTQAVAVTVTDVAENAPPTITSGTTATVTENAAVSTVVYDANATDPEGDAITYTIGGADAALFTINATTGEVRLINSADFETNADYQFTVTATSTGGSDTETVTLTVTDVNEAAVNLDQADSDNNPNTQEVVEGAGNGNIIFTDDVALASDSIIPGFTQGDVIRFTAPAGTTFGFTTAAGDVNDLEIAVNVNGVLSKIVLDEVLDSSDGFIFDEATAEAAVGFNFFEVVQPAQVAAADQSFA